ncbi:MAG: sugar ABC transporter substrate-binding protein [Dehalococcoidia bacterium]
MPVRPEQRVLPLLLLLPTLLLASCIESSATVSRSLTNTSRRASVKVPAPPGPKTTITWSYWGDAWEGAVNRRLVRAFEREHPDIKVQVVHKPWSEYFTWLRGEWQAGRSPDVMFLNYIPNYVAQGELEPLDRYVARDGMALDDFYPALLSMFRSGDVLYGLPRDNDTKVIYYNRDHFAEAGLSRPEAGWTWDDMRRAARILTRRDGMATRYGFGFEPGYWWLMWMWQRGCDVLDHPFLPTKTTLDSPACGEALQFLQDLILVDQVTPPPALLNTDDMSRLFREGRLSMVFGNHALVPVFTETPGLSWDVAPLPRDAVRTNVAGGAGFVVSRRSTQKDAAWQLVTFLSGRKAQAMVAESGVITPARRSVREDNIFMRQEGYRADVFLSETELGRPVPSFPGVTTVETLMEEGLAPLWRGERSGAEVARDLAPRVQDVINRLR